MIQIQLQFPKARPVCTKRKGPVLVVHILTCPIPSLTWSVTVAPCWTMSPCINHVGAVSGLDTLWGLATNPGADVPEAVEVLQGKIWASLGNSNASWQNVGIHTLRDHFSNQAKDCWPWQQDEVAQQKTALAASISTEKQWAGDHGNELYRKLRQPWRKGLRCPQSWEFTWAPRADTNWLVEWLARVHKEPETWVSDHLFSYSVPRISCEGQLFILSRKLETLQEWFVGFWVKRGRSELKNSQA